jgi:hypothetical protein
MDTERRNCTNRGGGGSRTTERRRIAARVMWRGAVREGWKPEVEIKDPARLPEPRRPFESTVPNISQCRLLVPPRLSIPIAPRLRGSFNTVFTSMASAQTSHDIDLEAQQVLSQPPGAPFIFPPSSLKARSANGLQRRRGRKRGT